MSPLIYKSLSPDVPLPTSSIFSLLFASDSRGDTVGGYPGGLPAFIDANTGTTLTRFTLKHLSLSLAHGLLSLPLSLKNGSTVLIFSPNSLAWPPILFGAIAAGLRCTLANSAYTPGELRYQWEDSGAELVFVSPGLVGVVREMFTLMGKGEEEVKRRVVVAGTEWLTGVPDEGAEAAKGFRQVESLTSHGSLTHEVHFDTPREADETAYLCYSSGTTGKPKGVETTHKNITSLLSIVYPIFPRLTPGQDVMIGVLPFYHIYGVVKLLHFPLFSGVPVVIMPRFDIALFCAHIARYKCTAALVVPPMLLALLRSPATEEHDLRSLGLLFSGAAPLGSTLVNGVRKRLENVGADVCVTQGYGLTETSPTTHLLQPADSLRKVGSMGVLLPNLEARLVETDEEGEGEKDVKKGEAGELWVRGKTIMKGYLNNPTATAGAITPDGWFKTGDVCIRDEEGFYTIVDRRKELIKYKGFQVPPAELESVLLQNEDIADVAVIGIDSREEETELPRAYVVPARPIPAEAQAKEAFGREVQAWIKTRVAGHKYLRGGVVVIDVIPKSAAGKILRRELRELAKKDLAVKAKL